MIGFEMRWVLCGLLSLLYVVGATNWVRAEARCDRNHSNRASGGADVKSLSDFERSIRACLRLIPNGSFLMGNSQVREARFEQPVHLVTLSPFYLSAYEVSFSQYDFFAEMTGRALPPDGGWGRGLRPVINVSWNDAQAFITWLNTISDRRYRLPSEAEWEYAARGGAETLFPWGNSYDPNRANGSGMGGSDRWNKTAPIGSFAPNVWGLHDLVGNVWEWTQDCWNDTFEGAPADGSAWMSGDCSQRVTRGGSWGSGPSSYLWVSSRFGYASVFSDQGFRLAHDP